MGEASGCGPLPSLPWFQPAPPPAPSNPLIRAWRDPKHPAHHRVIVNPHAAFYCEQGLMEMRVKGAQSASTKAPSITAQSVPTQALRRGPLASSATIR